MKDSGVAAESTFLEVLGGGLGVGGQGFYSIGTIKLEWCLLISRGHFMRYILMVLLTLAPDQTVDSLVAEIRALRMDLRSTAAAIQRVQIVMYRLQAQAASVEKATGRLDMAHAQCSAAENGRRQAAVQIEQMKKQNSQNEAEQRGIEAVIAQFQANMDLAASQAQQCLGEQADAEAQFRLEQAKMSELENQLEGLDRVLVGK